MSKTQVQVFLDSLKTRRSIYALGSEPILPDAEVIELVEEIVKNAPSPFNVQSSRVAFLLEANHKAFWSEIAAPATLATIPQEMKAGMEQRFQGFAKARLTILFFESQAALDAVGEKRPGLKGHFPSWSAQANGMAQFAVWTALSVLGYGCNVQHIGSTCLDKTRERFDIPQDWQPIAEMVVGARQGPPGQKTFVEGKERFKILQT